MKRMIRLALVIALVVTTASSLAPSSHAQQGHLPASMQAQAAAGGPTAESWWGGAAAMGCGFGLRARGFGNPYGVAATAILCAIAFIDAVT